MIPELLEKMFEAFRKLSQREQRLALATATVVLLVLLFMVYQRAQERLDGLNREITRLEDELLSHTRMLAHREIIESEYAAIAAQHSSEWTEAEIHDRLRQEIYRLARTNPPDLGANGIPVSPGGGGNLVEIPSLGQGQMSEGGQGYREYRINFRIPATSMTNMVTFLKRLHNSPQSLRIDALDLSRQPESDLVSASIDITRIVADGAAITSEPAPPAPADGIGRIPLNARAWQAVDGRVRNAVEARQEPYGALDIHLTAAAASVYMPHKVPGGAVYEMIINMASTSPEVTVGVGLDDAETTLLTPLKTTDGDGQQRQYTAQFGVPGDGSPVALLCPWITSAEPNVAVKVSGLMVRTVSEVYP